MAASIITTYLIPVVLPVAVYLATKTIIDPYIEARRSNHLAEREKRLDEQAKDLDDRAAERMAQYDKDIADLKLRISKLEGEGVAKDASIESKDATIKALNLTISGLKADKTKLEEDKTRLRTDKEQLQAALKKSEDARAAGEAGCKERIEELQRRIDAIEPELRATTVAAEVANNRAEALETGDDIADVAMKPPVGH